MPSGTGPEAQRGWVLFVAEAQLWLKGPHASAEHQVRVRFWACHRFPPSLRSDTGQRLCGL